MHTHRTAALSWLRLHCRELAVGAALALTVAVGFAVLPFLFAIAVVEWRSGSTRKRLFTFAFIAMLVGTIRWLWIELHRAPHRPWHPCAQCGRPIVEPSRAAYCSHACRSYARLERDAEALDPRIAERAQRRLRARRLRALADGNPDWQEVPI